MQDVSLSLEPATSEKDLEARVKASRVMFLTPIARDTTWQFTDSMQKTLGVLWQEQIWHRTYSVIGNSNLPRARNELIAQFLATDCTEAMLIDSDMQWEPQAVLRLLASAQPVIGAVGKKRVECDDTDTRGWCCRFLPSSSAPQPGVQSIHQDELGAIEVAAVGTGFLRIKREVFKRLMLIHPDWKMPGFESMKPEVRANYYKFFRFPHDEDVGEDFDFCKSWRELGGRIFVDPEISIGHVGSKVYKGDFRSLFEKAPAEVKP